MRNNTKRGLTQQIRRFHANFRSSRLLVRVERVDETHSQKENASQESTGEWQDSPRILQRV